MEVLYKQASKFVITVVNDTTAATVIVFTL